jgi:ATP-dependent helicase/DNAse subunit B
VAQPLWDALRAVPELHVPREQLCEWLSRQAEPQMLGDSLKRGVLFLPLMRARGITSRAVVFLGMAAGQFPFRVNEDPFLSEAARDRIAQTARDIGFRLPMHARLMNEMTLLFLLAHTAAERVHWVVPETDALGKAVVPTPWVQRYLQHWDTLQSKKDRIPRGPMDQARVLLSSDKGGAVLSPGMAAFLVPSVVTALDETGWVGRVGDCRKAREVQPEWNGLIADAAWVGRPRRVSVTGLESLAKCPYRFYGTVEMKWRPLGLLSISHQMNAMTQGSLLHSLLENLVRPHVGKSPAGDLGRAIKPCDVEEVLERGRQGALPGMSAEALAVLWMLPELIRNAVLEELGNRAFRYLQNVTREETPVELEWKREKEFPGLKGVVISGKIDRADRKEGKWVLLDYKMGGKPVSSEVKCGYRLQAIVYPWFVDESAEFYYVPFKDDEIGEVKALGPKSGEPPAADAVLVSMAGSLSRGVYVPVSNDSLEICDLDVKPCQYCELVSVCRRFERGAAARHLKVFQKLAGERLKFLQQALPKKETKHS